MCILLYFLANTILVHALLELWRGWTKDKSLILIEGEFDTYISMASFNLFEMDNGTLINVEIDKKKLIVLECIIKLNFNIFISL